jgi:hypothetical protein
MVPAGRIGLPQGTLKGSLEGEINDYREYFPQDRPFVA